MIKTYLTFIKILHVTALNFPHWHLQSIHLHIITIFLEILAKIQESAFKLHCLHTSFIHSVWVYNSGKGIIKHLLQTHLWKVFGQPHVGQFESQKRSKYWLEWKKYESHHYNNMFLVVTWTIIKCGMISDLNSL